MNALVSPVAPAFATPESAQVRKSYAALSAWLRELVLQQINYLAWRWFEFSSAPATYQKKAERRGYNVAAPSRAPRLLTPVVFAADKKNGGLASQGVTGNVNTPWSTAISLALAASKRVAHAVGFTIKWLALVLAALSVVVTGVAYANYRYFHERQSIGDLQLHIEARSRPGVYSASDKLIGVVPPVSGAIYDLSEVGVASDEIPDDFFRLLLRLEDSNAGKWWRGHIAGVDWPAIPVRAIVGKFKKDRAAGASTLWMQAVSLAMNNKQKYGTIERKFREYAAATELHTAYGGDLRRISRDYANMAAYARGMGGDVRGLAAAADIIFNTSLNTSPQNLTLAQSAILASAPNCPLWIGEDSDRARQCWKVVKNRAIVALKAEFGVGAADAVEEILVMGPLPPVRQKFEGLPDAVTGTLAARTRYFVEPIFPAIRHELLALPSGGLQ